MFRLALSTCVVSHPPTYLSTDRSSTFIIAAHSIDRQKQRQAAWTERESSLNKTASSSSSSCSGSGSGSGSGSLLVQQEEESVLLTERLRESFPSSLSSCSERRLAFFCSPRRWKKYETMRGSESAGIITARRCQLLAFGITNILPGPSAGPDFKRSARKGGRGANAPPPPRVSLCVQTDGCSSWVSVPLSDLRAFVSFRVVGFVLVEHRPREKLDTSFVLRIKNSWRYSYGYTSISPDEPLPCEGTPGFERDVYTEVNHGRAMGINHRVRCCVRSAR